MPRTIRIDTKIHFGAITKTILIGIPGDVIYSIQSPASKKFRASQAAGDRISAGMT
jgi:hypothetical protein